MGKAFDGAALRAARTARGWSQERLARELDVGATAVNRWEQGHNRPHPANRRRLFRLFAVLAPPAEPSVCAVWWRGVALPHEVVAAQVRRGIAWGGLPGEPLGAELARERWMHLREVRRTAEELGVTEATVGAALCAALDRAWTRDQQTHPGESWCVEMDTPDAQARIGYVLTPPDAG